MPQRKERHEPSHATVGPVVFAVERLRPGLHATGLVALYPMSHGHGAVLGGTYPPSVNAEVPAADLHYSPLLLR